MEIFTQPSDIIAQIDIAPGMKVADLGAGSGHYTKALSEIVSTDGTVFAVDIQQDVLTRLRDDMERLHALHNIEYLWGDLEHPRGTKIADESVDVVVVSNTLFQIEDKAGALREIKRICKNTAEVLFVDWSDSHGGLGPIPDHIIAPATAQELFTTEGFIYYKDIQTGPHHYGQLYKVTAR